MSDPLNDALKDADESEKQTQKSQRQKQKSRTSSNHKQNNNVVNTRAQTVNGKQVVVIPWVHRVKVWAVRCLMPLPLFCVYMMYVTYEAGELGYNTVIAAILAFVAQGATYIALKFSNTQDVWNEMRRLNAEED